MLNIDVQIHFSSGNKMIYKTTKKKNHITLHEKNLITNNW